jgi:hypothetical protein
MAEFDDFARTLLEEAKHFFEKAQTETSKEGKAAYLHAALIVAFCSLEAHINAIAEEFLLRRELSVLERSVLEEREFKLQDGEFVLTDNLKMYRLTDRIEFLHKRFSGKAIDRTAPWWGELKKAIDYRNSLGHPKEAHEISAEIAKAALEAVLDCLQVLYKAIYHRGYPPKPRGLDSIMTF